LPIGIKTLIGLVADESPLVLSINQKGCDLLFQLLNMTVQKTNDAHKNCRGGHDVIWRWRRLLSCLLMRDVVCWKIMINFLESPPSIMVTRNLWSARVWVRDWLCKGKTHHPQCTLPKISCIVDWLFLDWISIYWSYLRLKADLSSWESLYLIGLNPNCSKVWILTSYLFTYCIFNTWGCILSYNFTPHKY
jgi:hypothetical protein